MKTLRFGLMCMLSAWCGEPPVAPAAAPQRQDRAPSEVVAVLEGLLIDDASAEPFVDTALIVRDEVTGAERHARTDDTGRFTVRPMAVGHAWSVELPDARPRRLTARIHPLLPGTERRTIRVIENLTVSCRARFLDDGTPCDTAIVTADCVEELPVRRNRDGSFAILGVPAEPLTREGRKLHLRIRARTPSGFAIHTFLPHERLREATEWTVYVAKGCVLDGAIRRADGSAWSTPCRAWLEFDDALEPDGPIGVDETIRPIAHLDDGLLRSVPICKEKETIGRRNSDEPLQPRALESDGRFRFTGLPPRFPYRLVVELPSGEVLRHAVPEFARDGAAQSLEIVAPDHRGGIAFSARRGGAPCAARISWERKNVRGSLETGVDGEGRIESMPAGRYSVTAFLEPSSIRIERTIDVPAEGIVPLLLESRDENAIRGRVVDRSGIAQPGVRVGLCPAPRAMVSPCVIERHDPLAEPFDTFVVSDEAGEFRFAGLPQVRYFWVDIADPRFERYPCSPTARGSDGIELTALPPEPTLHDRR